MKKIILLTAALLLLILIITEILPNRTTSDETAVNGVYELKKIKLGGYNQTVLVRGFDRNNPVIIFLHGGPGFSSISYTKKFQSEIERNYVVVNWDQRGSGKSFSVFLNGKTMNEQQLLRDLDELVDYLCEEYDKEKVYIAGHSWGTVLGKDYVQKYPDKVEYFISIGQYVSDRDSNTYSYNFLYDEASRRDDQNTLDNLLKLGKPPYDGNIKKEALFRKLINKYDGNEISVDINKEMFFGTILEPEYSVLDLLKLTLGNYYSLYHLYDHYSVRDFRNENLRFEVPVVFILGKKDLVTNYELAEEYFNIIDCDNKKLILFDNSAHEPQYEEIDKFSEVINNL